MKTFPVLILAGLGLARFAYAQVGGPTIGLVPDSGSVRTMYGIPAAGAVGGLQAVDRTLGLVVISPTQSFGLATESSTGAVVVLQPASDGIGFQSTALSGATASPDRMVFSPNGSTAVLWFAASLQMQVVTGLPGSPVIRQVSASSMGSDLVALPGALAVSDDGQWSVGAWAQGVYAFNSTGQPTALAVLGQAEAVCFFHGSDDLAILSASQVVTVTGLGGQPGEAVVWSKPADSTPDAPVQLAQGMAASSDNTLLTITGNLGGVFTINLANGYQTSYVDCACAPTGLAQLGATSFRLTGVTAGAVKIYDAASSDVWFVPQTARVAPRPVRRLPDGGNGSGGPPGETTSVTTGITTGITTSVIRTDAVSGAQLQ
jgi:hypothetical protein